ncbi:MAG: hypothetical protein GVY24_04625 [Planctomycetes bacterium]|jgi:hypothetical protein|nr:hypothetical protein [Planctomycetota bacterium]
MSCLLCVCLSNAHAYAAAVTIEQAESGHTLMVDEQPYAIKGAGGDASKKLLADAGGNTFRTWGVGDDTQAKLDEAQRLGLKVVLGIWLEHERHGFDYNDADRVAAQYEKVRTSVERFKDHPALLMWALGNEMEGYEAGDNAAIWSHLQACAALVKRLDPHHPTMTVIAEIGGQRVQNIHRLCPDIDVIGINTYAGVMSIPQRYREAGGTKPYIVTEFGPPGTWEVEKNSFGAIEEPTSTLKAKTYAKAYQTLAEDPLCLGSFAFTWGFKQEATATWFGMFASDGSKTAAVDAMTEAWSGNKPDNLCPAIEPLTVSAESVNPGGTIDVTLTASDPEGDALKTTWRLYAEAGEYFTGGDYQATPKQFPDAISEATNTHATLTMPAEPGVYRVYAFVKDGNGGSAMANHPLLVKGEAKGPKGLAGNLPFVIYGDEKADPNYAPSGYMGDFDFVKMDENSRINPHTGETCLRVSFEKNSGWGGVVWQHPANDWGDLPGGFDLSDAEQLVFHARGANGGEKVNFGFGTLGADTKFADSAGTTTAITLTDEWKQYRIDLEGKDLSRIKTGFLWSAGAQGDNLTFFLDEIRYE